jgi:hypothetical protein
VPSQDFCFIGANFNISAKKYQSLRELLHKPCRMLHEAILVAPERKLGSVVGRSRELISVNPKIKAYLKWWLCQTIDSQGTAILVPAYIHRCIRTGLVGTCTRCKGHQIPGCTSTD